MADATVGSQDRLVPARRCQSEPFHINTMPVTTRSAPTACLCWFWSQENPIFWGSLYLILYVEMLTFQYFLSCSSLQDFVASVDSETLQPADRQLPGLLTVPLSLCVCFSLISLSFREGTAITSNDLSAILNCKFPEIPTQSQDWLGLFEKRQRGWWFRKMCSGGLSQDS